MSELMTQVPRRRPLGVSSQRKINRLVRVKRASGEMDYSMTARSAKSQPTAHSPLP